MCDHALDDGGPQHAHNLEEHSSYLRGFQYGQGVWHSCEGLIYLLDIQSLKCVRGWGTRLHEGSGVEGQEGGIEKQTEDKKDGTANERQSSIGRNSMEHADVSCG